MSFFQLSYSPILPLSTIAHKSGLISGGESQPIIVIGSTGDSDSVAQGTGSRLNYLANMATCTYSVYLLYLLSAICLGCKSYCRLMLMPPTTGVWRRQMANKQIRCGRGHHSTHSGHTLALVTEIRRVKGSQDGVMAPTLPRLCGDNSGSAARGP